MDKERHNMLPGAVAAISSKQWGDDMASAERELYNGGLGAEPPSGSRGTAPCQGARGLRPLKLKEN